MRLPADLKHDNILFRPSDLLATVTHELVERPSLTYDCGTLVNPPVIPVRSQSLPFSPDDAVSEKELDVVLADVGHCKFADGHTLATAYMNHTATPTSAQHNGKTVIFRSSSNPSPSAPPK